LYLSLRNIMKRWKNYRLKARQVLLVSLPLILFVTTVAVGMVFFFTN